MSGGPRRLRLLAIADAYVPAGPMREGLAGLEVLGVEVAVRTWPHPSVEALQADNIRIEQDGPEAVPVPEALLDLAGFDVLVVQFAPVRGSVLAAAPDLALVGVLRAGLENVDLTAAGGRGVAVMSTLGRNARAVAEFTVGLILAETRNIARAHAALRGAVWRKDYPNGAAIPELAGRTVGLVGLGHVGRLVARLLAGFGCRLLAHDPYATGDAGPCRLVGLDALLAESDVVTIHARLTPETRHLIGARELARMRPTAVLINTARSGLVDEHALAAALATGRLAGAALDVFDVEPLPEGHSLLRLDNVTLTPHLAGTTIDAFRNTPRLFAADLARLLRGDAGSVPIVNGIRPPFAAGILGSI